MVDPDKKGFLEELGAELNIDIPTVKKEFESVRNELSQAGIEVKEVACKTLTDAEKLAAKAAIKAEETYKKFEINDRLYGSAGGAKLGVLFGFRAGPKGAAAGAAVGGIIGFIYGDKAVKKFKEWRDGHKPTTNDQKSKSPADGP